MKCASPQSIFFLPALLFQLQDPLLQPIENLDRVNVSEHLTWFPVPTAPLAGRTHHAAFIFLIHQTASVLGCLERKTGVHKQFLLSTLKH